MNTNIMSVIWFFEDVNLCPYSFTRYKKSHNFDAYKKSDCIYFEEDSANKVYLIEKGKVKNGYYVEITLDDANAAGLNSTWIITDDQGSILGLPPTQTAVEGVNFVGAGVGVCLIWYLRYENGIEGLSVDMNANDL